MGFEFVLIKSTVVPLCEFVYLFELLLAEFVFSFLRLQEAAQFLLLLALDVLLELFLIIGERLCLRREKQRQHSFLYLKKKRALVKVCGLLNFIYQQHQNMSKQTLEVSFSPTVTLGPSLIQMAYIFLHGSLVFLNELLHLLGEAVPLVLQLLVQPQPVLVHLCLQLVLLGHQLLLMLPPHALVAGHLLPQLRVLLVLLHLTGDLGR